MPLVSQNLNSLAAGLFVLGCAIAALVLGKSLLVPVVLAMLLAFVLSPIVSWLASARIPRALAAVVSVLLVVGVVVASSIAFSSQLLTLTGELGTYRENIVSKVRSVMSSGSAESVLQKAAKSINAIEEGVKQELGMKGPAGAPTPSSPGSPATTGNQGGAASSESVLDRMSALVGPLATGGLTLLITLFLLLGWHDLRDRIVRVMGTDQMSATTAALSDAGERLSRLFLTLAALNAGFGVVVAIMLSIIGVPNAILWGAFAFVMRFVPYVGSILATLPPTLLALAVDPGWGMAIATLAVFMIGEPLLGHVLEPMLLGKSAGLSPLAMVLSAAFWTVLWGPIGLIIAAPITMTLAMLGEYVPRLQFLSVLLGDAPALQPEEKFYYRLLSEDGISAADAAMDEMPDARIPEIADEIILPALRLAARDQRLGVLDEERVKGIETAMREVQTTLPELAGPGGREPDADEPECLVIPARGPLDVIAADFVADAIRDTTGVNAVATLKSTGMLAVSTARAHYADHPPTTIIVSTVGGLDWRFLFAIAARAERDFPSARVLACNWIEGSVGQPVKPGRVVAVSRLREALANLPQRGEVRLEPLVGRNNDAAQAPEPAPVPQPAA